ncbi:MAG TPA: D-glycerate dehydrogenase [Phycisphaerae bacterium]|nr:D-glycerate dehydrogenase [Phycisphaerae bacterium]
MAIDQPTTRGHRVYLTRSVPEAGIALLASAGLTIRMNPLPRALTPDELCREVGRYDAVMCQATDRIDESVLEASRPRCRIFANCAVGYDNIDLAAAGRLGIVVTNTPDVLTEATADLTWALMLAAARRVGEAERLVRAGVWRGWNMLDFLGADVYGKTLGIVGAGRIGTAVARRARGFDMKLLYFARSDKPAMAALGAERRTLAEVMEESDFVSVHLSLTRDTRRLIDDRAIRRMKKDAIFINTSRGAIVDQGALATALAQGRIAAAGLDVYLNEPMIPAELMALENVVLLPHIGSATVSTRNRMAQTAAANVVSVLRGEGPLNPVGI